MASVLRMGVRFSAGIFDRALLGLSTQSATLPHFPTASVGAFPAVCFERLQRAATGGACCRGLAAAASGGGGPWGRTSPAPAPARTDRLHRRSQPQTQALSDSESDSESDSDDEPRRERGTTDFWRRKMRSFHNLIDINNDGVVSFDDFTILAERFINLGHLTPQQQEDFKEALKIVWEDQWGKVHPYNLVTTEQYLENMHHIINDRELSRKAHHFLPHLFEALDSDKDGHIRVNEFKLFFECLGLSEEDAITSYKIIDVNGDGVLSLKEFVRLGRDYFTCEDERHPSTHFWGPLISP